MDLNCILWVEMSFSFDDIIKNQSLNSCGLLGKQSSIEFWWLTMGEEWENN